MDIALKKMLNKGPLKDRIPDKMIVDMTKCLLKSMPIKDIITKGETKPLSDYECSRDFKSMNHGLATATIKSGYTKLFRVSVHVVIHAEEA
jgi:hypothetical protein